MYVCMYPMEYGEAMVKDIGRIANVTYRHKGGYS